MQELKIIEDWEFGRIRVVIIDGEPWFVGKDVAEVLGYTDAKVAIRTHVDSDDRQIIQRGKTDTFETDSGERHLIERSQSVTFEIPNRGWTAINESGLYSLIMGSRKKDAKRFKRWVTSEVLPASAERALIHICRHRTSLQSRLGSRLRICWSRQCRYSKKLVYETGGYEVELDKER